jgi:hypothetical protein
MNTPSSLPVLIHIHLFKNGGSTLDWILRKNFANQFMEFHGKTADSVLLASDIEQMVENHPAHVAFSSHHFRLPLDTITAKPIFPIIFLRHPLDRIASMFDQERRMAPECDDWMFASLSNWIETSIKKRPYIFCDSQVSFLARGGVYYEPPNELCLEDATEALDGLPFFGLVSEYDASIVLLENQLRHWWPEFDGAYFPQNEGSRDRGLESRLERLASHLTPSAYTALLRNNKYDLALFEHAKTELAARTSRVTDFSAKLDSLKQRSSLLR